MMERHTFAICAYKESPFLEECICSLKNQTQQSLIIMITSTPNEHIKNLVERYNIPLYVNTGESGITQDWNFAYSMTNTELVTIAHQDDVYLPDYTKEIYRVISSVKHPLIAFTNYGELREGQPVLNNSLLRIKRFALWLLRFPVFQNSRFIRRRILSLGNMICCPAVTFVKNNLPEQVFKHNFRSNEDWEAWEALSRNKGAFAYSPEEGTKAASFPDQIDDDIKEDWQAEVMELQEEVIFDKNETLTGTQMYAFIEGKVADENAYVGRTYRDAPNVDGYIFINTEQELMSGDIVKVRITGAYEYDLIGEII